jgi:hypothetical protein
VPSATIQRVERRRRLGHRKAPTREARRGGVRRHQEGTTVRQR